MRWVTVSEARFKDVMERCGGYNSGYDVGPTHNHQEWVRNLTAWSGEQPVGYVKYSRQYGTIYTIAGYLDDYYK